AGCVGVCCWVARRGLVWCWLVGRGTCVNRVRAGLFFGEHACIGLVLACSSANMHASGSCWVVYRRTCVHGLVLACSSANMRASTLCWLVHRRTCMHRPRAGLFIRKHACTVACQFSEALAIKCAKSGFRRWLPREVRHASEIGHPSVCRIFEIHTVPTERGEIDFLTMEFLDETLADLLQPAQYRRTRRTPLRSSSAEVWRKRIAQASET